MIKNEDIICLSSIDWDFIWQGHQEIMTRLARNGNRVLFIENTGVRTPTIRDIGRIKNRIYNWRRGVHGIRKIEEGLYIYSPLILPFPYFKIARFINKRLVLSVLSKWLRAVGFAEPIAWVFLPTDLSLELVNAITPKVLVYYCIDSFQASSEGAKKIKDAERRMLKSADLVFATSQELLNYCAGHNDSVHYFPFGVNIDNFMLALNSPDASVPADMQNVKRPVAGYVGGIHKWIDFDLVRHLAARNSDISFVFCGPIQTDVRAIRNLPNVVFLGQKDPKELPRYVKEFDIALIPYKISEYTRNVYPTKLNEYLALGKPVVSTKLPEIIKFNNENHMLVKTAADRDEFSLRIREALDHPPDEEERALAVNAAKKNSWAVKLEKMSALIENVIHKKMMEKERSWKANIARIYKGARKRIVPALAGVAVIYMVIFHSPLVWILAEPLRIQDYPQKADAIAVFGGGVGESGKVGQGHEERVDSAVMLYKKGFAKKILYLSGYRHIMKEAEVMRALSVLMDAKEDDILLDDTPVNTYDMIMDLKKFSKDNGWRRLILVSSPYHMRRLKLLCDRHLKGIKIYYVPVLQNSFYASGSGVKLSHINGVLHEYLAIAYYKLKKYI